MVLYMKYTASLNAYLAFGLLYFRMGYVMVDFNSIFLCFVVYNT